MKKYNIYQIEQTAFYITPFLFVIILAFIKLIIDKEILLISKNATPHFMMLCILTLASIILVAGLFSVFQIVLLYFIKQPLFIVRRILFLLLILIEYYFLEVYKDSIRGAFTAGREELYPIIISLLMVIIVYLVIFFKEKKVVASKNKKDAIDELHDN